MKTFKILIRSTNDPDEKARLKLSTNLSIDQIKEQIKQLFEPEPEQDLPS